MDRWSRRREAAGLRAECSHTDASWRCAGRSGESAGWKLRLEDGPRNGTVGRDRWRSRPVSQCISRWHFDFHASWSFGVVLLAALYTGKAGAQSPAPQPAPTTTISAAASRMKRSDRLPYQITAEEFLQDQQAFLTSPFRMRSGNLFFIVPAIFASSILVGSDTRS